MNQRTIVCHHFSLPITRDQCFNPSMNITELSSSQLRTAADLQEKIAKLQSELAQLDGGEIPVPFFKSKQGRKKKGMSAAGRARIAAAQKLRWSKIKRKAKSVAKAVVKVVKKARRKMSAEAKAKISAAAKLRWAKVRAEKAA